MANSGSEVIMVHSEGRLKYGADRQKALNKAIAELNKQGKRVVNIVDGPLQPFGPLGNVFCYVTILWEEDASSSQSAAAGAEKTAVPQPATINVTAENFASILTRIDLFLEDGDWDTALAYCEAALNFDATNATVYTKKLLAEVRASSIEELYTRTASFGGNKSYEKAVRFADDELKARLQEANRCVTNNIVEWSQLNIEASKLLQSAIDSKDDPVEAKKLLDSAQKIYVRIPTEFQRSIGLDSVTECNKVQRIIQNAEVAKMAAAEKKVRDEKLAQEKEVTRKARNKKALIVIPVIIAIIAVICVALTLSNNKKIPTYEQSLVGCSVTWYDGDETSNINYTYTFYENNEVVMHNTSKFITGKQVDYSYLRTYSVKVSLFGKVTVTVETEKRHTQTYKAEFSDKGELLYLYGEGNAKGAIYQKGLAYKGDPGKTPDEIRSEKTN